jgi:DNA-binding NarL/FixJ family response regulator
MAEYSSPEQIIRIVLADDQVLFVESLKKVLESSGHFAVEGIAADGEKAVQLVGTLKPDIVVLDVRMPVMDGVEAARIIRNRYPEVKIVMLTTFPDDTYVHEALNCGACGYLLKDISIHLLVKSLESVAAGAVLMSPSVTEGFTDHHRSSRKSPAGKTAAVHEQLKELTEREMDVLTLISMGYGNNDIEKALNLGKQTVRNYISLIYAKIRAKDRFEAMRIGIEAGLPGRGKQDRY